MLENLINSPFLISLALTLLHFLWQGLLVAAILKSTFLIFNNSKAQLRYTLSLLAMLVNLLLPVITFAIVYRAELFSVNTVDNSLNLSKLIQDLKQQGLFFSDSGITKYLPSLLPYISILWLTIITLLASKLLRGISTVNRLPLQGAFAPSDKLQNRFELLVKQIQLTITPKLLISLKVDVPMAIGWLKPVVLLPANMISGLSSIQLEMLILHELAHIKRYDYLVNFLQTLVEILLFFHPGVLWVSKQMRNEREYCCDDIAVQHGGDAVAYAHTLADTASLCTKIHRHTIPNMAMAASGGDLKQRVVRLVDYQCAPKNNMSKLLASATIVFSVLLLSSKQLLTMPLLNIWHDKIPWDQPNLNTNKQVQTSNNAINKDVPNNSIAQLLLTPQKEKQTEQIILVKKHSPVIAKPVFLMANKTVTLVASNLEIAKHNQTLLDDPQVISSETKQPANVAIQSTKVIESSTVNDSLMVDKIVKRTKISNSIQEKSVSRNTHNRFESNELNHIELVTQDYSQDDFFQATSTATLPIWKNAEQLKSAYPVYPSAAKRKGIEIEVHVNFTIDIEGQIKDIKFARQNKINYFKSSIRSAIKKWRFLPAKVDDQPVESQMSKVFAFSLHS